MLRMISSGCLHSYISFTLRRSSILTLTIVLYALTSTIAGYFSGSFYAQYGGMCLFCDIAPISQYDPHTHTGKRWMRSLFLTASLWPGAIAVVSLAVNTVAIFYLSTKAIPFGTMVAVMAIWTFVILPLNVLGAVIGRNWNATAHFPTRGRHCCVSHTHI